MNPEYQRGVIFLQLADAKNNGNTLVYNQAAPMDGTQPMRMGRGTPVPGQYGPVQSDASNPTYCRGFRPITYTVQVFNDLRPLGPDYDVVSMFVGGNFNASLGVDSGNGRIECGLGVVTEEGALTYPCMIFNAGTTPDTSQIIITSGRDNPTPAAGYYATAGIWTNDLVAENAAGFGGATCTLAAGADFFYGVISATAGSLKGQSARLEWNPWAGLGLPAITTGVPQWVAMRWHKYDPAIPNQHKVSVIASWDATVRTLTFYAYGSQSALGILSNSPRNHFFNLIGEYITATDIATDAVSWEVIAAQTGARWSMVAEDKSIPQALWQLRGTYERNTGPVIDQTTGTYYDLQGKVENGREIQWTLPTGTTALDYNTVGGWPSDSGSQAGVWLVSSDGGTWVPQYIKNWGYGAGIRNYLNNTTAGFSTFYHGVIRFVVTQGSISDLRGCYFVAKDAAGATIQEVPIAGASFIGDITSVNASGGTSTSGGNIMSFPL